MINFLLYVGGMIAFLYGLEVGDKMFFGFGMIFAMIGLVRS